MASGPTKKCTIVILGESGVGKTTWINAFANYLRYSSFSEAAVGERICPIPFQFSEWESDQEVTYSYYQERQTDDNELFGDDAQSTTQCPKSHIFKVGGTIVTLIDTPGILDTRGLEQDKVNIDLVISQMSRCEQINAICILLKTEQNRLGEHFKYCMVQLMKNLDKCAGRNVLFCFTNARKDFLPTKIQTRKPLSVFLAKENMSQYGVQLIDARIFSFDNIALQALAKKNCGMEVDDYSEMERCWKASAESTQRMINYIDTLKPYLTARSKCIAEARRIITIAAEPIAVTTQCMAGTLDELDKCDTEYIRKYETEVETFPSAATMCTSSRCSKRVGANSVPRVCHDDCYLAPSAWWCEVMTGLLDRRCKKCGCGSFFHERKNYRVFAKEVMLVVKREELKIRRKAIETERDDVVRITACLSTFIRQHAIVQDSSVDVISKQLDSTVQNATAATEKELKLTLSSYKRATQSMEQTEVTEENVMTSIDELYSLPEYGKGLKKATEKIEEAIKKDEETRASSWFVKMSHTRLFQTVNNFHGK